MAVNFLIGLKQRSCKAYHGGENLFMVEPYIFSCFLYSEEVFLNCKVSVRYTFYAWINK